MGYYMYIDIDKARILSLNLVTKYINSLSNLDAVIFSDFFERSDSIKVDKLRMVMLEMFYKYLTSDEMGSLDEKKCVFGKCFKSSFVCNGKKY